ncbi:MATE family efflux transporter [Archaeoglobus neptunius]|uniref:hypothetical protein n=1 Tax=Archaeoglobus neptunius TaxID=2798580 RepID=UPI001926D2E9|nr:hypothetical protein [Archaeoglobus neptunius]
MKRGLPFYTLFFIFSLALMKLSGVISKIIVARFISPYEYGIITLVTISLPAMFFYFTNFCLHDLLSNSKKGRNYFGFAFSYSLTASLIAAFFVFTFHKSFFSFLNLPLDNWELLFIAFFVSLTSGSLLNDITGLFRGLKLYSSTSIIASLPAILKLLMLVGFLATLRKLDFIIAILVFSFSSFVSLGFVLLFHRGTIFGNFRLTPPDREILYFGASVYLLGLFGGLSQTISKVVVSHDLGVTWQGYFDASLTVISILSFAFASMSFISIPEATSSADRDELLYETGKLGDVVRALFAFLVLGIMLLCMYPSQFVGLLFGKDYTVSSRFLPVLAVGYIFLYVQQFLAYLNVSYQKPAEYRSLVLATLICLLFLVPTVHTLTTMVGILGTYSVLTFFYFLYLLITLKLSKDLSPASVFVKKIHRLVIATAITAFIGYFTSFPNFLYDVLFVSIIFTLLIFLTGYLSKDLLKSIF